MRLLLFFMLSCSVFASEWGLRRSQHLGEPGAAVQCIRKELHNGAELYLLKADMGRCELRVSADADPNVAAALERIGCVAGVNGGYFHATGEPLGLVISDARVLHSLEKAKLLSGLVVYSAGRASLLRREEFKPSRRITQALQAGPFLVDNRRLVQGLNAKKRAARTVALSDGRDRFALLVSSSVTLERMGRILSDPSVITELEVVRALNLDGGSSSALWVKNPRVNLREFKAVANAIGFAPK